MAITRTVKEMVFCSNMMKELGSDTRFDRLPLCPDNTSALHVTKNRTYIPRVKHVALRYFVVQELMRKARINIHNVKTEDQVADIRIKHLRTHRQRYLLKLISEFRAQN